MYMLLRFLPQTRSLLRSLQRARTPSAATRRRRPCRPPPSGRGSHLPFGPGANLPSGPGANPASVLDSNSAFGRGMHADCAPFANATDGRHLHVAEGSGLQALDGHGRHGAGLGVAGSVTPDPRTCLIVPAGVKGPLAGQFAAAATGYVLVSPGLQTAPPFVTGPGNACNPPAMWSTAAGYAHVQISGLPLHTTSALQQVLSVLYHLHIDIRLGNSVLLQSEKFIEQTIH